MNHLHRGAFGAVGWFLWPVVRPQDFCACINALQLELAWRGNCANVMGGTFKWRQGVEKASTASN